MGEAGASPKSSRRLALPGGGWWDLSLRPLWKHVRLWEGGDECLVETAILHLTLDWSFDEPIGVDGLKARDPDDLACVLEAIISTLETPSESKRVMAERLYRGLISGVLPEEFAEVHIMASTGWSWQELQNTPADVVEMMVTYLCVAQAIGSGSSLDLPDQEQNS